jgi:hypothetical protein
MEIIVIIGIILAIIWFKVRYWNTWAMTKPFKSKNVIVFGKKGDGKDVLFADVIAQRRVKHLSNIQYDKRTEVMPLGYLSVAPNTFPEFIAGEVQVVPKRIYERVDYYLSDGGIYLPSQYDSLLNKLYPSLPIFYALSRHLGAMNVHTNVQNLERLWIKLREQADYYIRCRGLVKLFNKPLILFGHMFLKITHYEDYKDACELLRPIHKIMNGDAAAVARSERGLIKENLVAIPIRRLKYDSRYFHKVLYGVESPKIKPLILGKRKYRVKGQGGDSEKCSVVKK